MSVYKETIENYRKDLQRRRTEDLVVEAAEVWGLRYRDVRFMEEDELIETCVACFENELAGGGGRRMEVV